MHTGPVRFVPGSDPENVVTLGRDNATTDDEGNFSLDLKLPKRPSDGIQFIRTSMRSNTGPTDVISDSQRYLDQDY